MYEYLCKFFFSFCNREKNNLHVLLNHNNNCIELCNSIKNYIENCEHPYSLLEQIENLIKELFHLINLIDYYDNSNEEYKYTAVLTVYTTLHVINNIQVILAKHIQDFVICQKDNIISNLEYETKDEIVKTIFICEEYINNFFYYSDIVKKNTLVKINKLRYLVNLGLELLLIMQLIIVNSEYIYHKLNNIQQDNEKRIL